MEQELSTSQNSAIDIIISNPGIKRAEVAKTIEVNVQTLNKWFKNPAFSNACYDRFMQIRSTKLMSVLDAMFREAEEGSVAAAKLIFEHYGKLDRRLTITLQKSPFELWDANQRLGNVQEAKFTIDDAKEIAQNHEITSDLPPRNPEANQHYRKITEGKKVKSKIRTTKQKIKKNKNQNARYHLRKRAKAVELQMLPPGKPKEEKRRAWMRELKKREEFMGIIYPD